MCDESSFESFRLAEGVARIPILRFRKCFARPNPGSPAGSQQTGNEQHRRHHTDRARTCRRAERGHTKENGLHDLPVSHGPAMPSVTTTANNRTPKEELAPDLFRPCSQAMRTTISQHPICQIRPFSHTRQTTVSITIPFAALYDTRKVGPTCCTC